MNFTAYISPAAAAKVFNYDIVSFYFGAVATSFILSHMMLRIIFPASFTSTNAPNTHRVPPNVRFEIDDVEADWTYHQNFDYIHCRFMGNAIRNWPRLVGQCFE